MTLSQTRAALLLCAFAVSLLGVPAQAGAAEQIHVSKNWAGYAATEGSYTAISASWTVTPSVGTNRSVSADATWVGIGGFTHDDLIQAGTQAIVRNGTTTYQAWYELLPDYQRAITLPIKAGDAISVSLSELSLNEWRIRIENRTTGASFQLDVPYTSSHSSAEWIVERPLAVTNAAEGYLPLSNFGTTTFTNAQAVRNGVRLPLADIPASRLIMSGTGTRLLAATQQVQGQNFSIRYLSKSESAKYMRELRRTYRFRRTGRTQQRQKDISEIDTKHIEGLTFGPAY